ncbi:MAG TPA: formate dehydrogenase subunit alpha [Burkholderiales bacterium]|nr:formate dehydrogenase subunit alpha [Burkholderiales bacterium]
MLKVTIDGQAHEFPEGLTIFKALSQIHVDVPHLCHDERLKPYGGCRLCIVEVDGKSHPVSACDNKIADGMVIRSWSDRLHALRKTNLTLLAARYPADAVDAEPWRPFHRYLREYGVAARSLPAKDNWCDASNPYIAVDMSRCIYCYRCVRICEEVQGQFVWQVYQRGEATHIRPQTGVNLLTSECVSCGACVDTCPSGALSDKSVVRHGEAQRWTETTCVYCGTGCQMKVGEREGKIVEIRPVLDAAVNRGHLCAKGRYAFEFASAPDRITRPMIRKNGEWREVDWDTALAFTAERLSEIQQRHGPDAIGVLGSARATNEENYLAQKFARTVLGTNNVDCCARVCHQPSAVALKRMLGTGAATNSFDDIERAATIMLCGCNPTENHPIVGARIKQAVLAGAKLIVVDPRRTELVRCADLYLPVIPGHNVQLFNAMACAILEEELEDCAFIAKRVTDFSAYRDFVMKYRPEAVANACGVSAERIRDAARLYATAKPAMCFHGLGLTEHTQGSEGVMTLINLALLTGNLGKPGSGINPLRGQNNVQGSAQMGCEPTTLTGAQPLDEARALFERIWGCDIPTTRGLTLLDMVDAAAAGRLKAMWSIGYDFYLTLSDLNRTKEALSQLDLVIVQDLFLNETAKAFGDVFLPAASVFEKDGTFMNSDRRVQRVRKVIEPIGEAWPDWRIICALAERMGKNALFAFSDAEAIWNEVRRVWPKGAGLSYARLEKESLHWPCAAEDHPGTPVLHTDSFATAKQAALRRIDFRPTQEQCDDAFPWLLNTGRTLYHFNAGTMTYRTDNLVLQASDFLDIAPADAERLHLKDGARVKVRSRYGAAILPVRISERMREGELFTTFHDPSLYVNQLTSSYRDSVAKTPEYKVTAVTIERVD